MSCNDEQMIKKALTEAFNEIDGKKQGFIDEGELEKVLLTYYKKCGRPVDQAKIKADADSFIKDVDKNRDGKIELEEFISYFIQFCK